MQLAKFLSLIILPTVSSFSDILKNILGSNVLSPLDCVDYRMQLFACGSSLCVTYCWKILELTFKKCKLMSLIRFQPSLNLGKNQSFKMNIHLNYNPFSLYFSTKRSMLSAYFQVLIVLPVIAHKSHLQPLS